MTKPRLRDLDIIIGRFLPGPYNAITDVPGVHVGHKTLIYDAPRIARTGITIIAPREGKIWADYAFAAIHSFNGNGEMTGAHWLNETGLLSEPIAITNTHQTGLVRDALVAYSIEQGHTTNFVLPVVAETYDGWLNDINAFHVTKEDVYEALASTRGGPVPEGNVGGGTGMICHDFKGGIGTASRQVLLDQHLYTVGVLLQANHGDRELLRVNGVPVGRKIGPAKVPLPWDTPPTGGSVIVIIATDAPLLPIQCKRLAQRATVGLARVGSIGHNGSGDIYLAFSTGNHIPPQGAEHPYPLTMVPNDQLNDIFEAVAEAVEEATLNAMVAAETMTGFKSHTAYALPLDELQRMMTG